MFNLSGSEIIVILLLALVVLGPDKLPEAMRKAGRTWAELRKLSSGFQEEVRKGFEEPSTELRQTAAAVKKAATFTTTPVKGAVKGAVKSLLDPPATHSTTSTSTDTTDTTDTAEAADETPEAAAATEETPAAVAETAQAADETPEAAIDTDGEKPEEVATIEPPTDEAEPGPAGGETDERGDKADATP